MYLLHKIISDIKYTLLAFTFMLPNGIHAGKCYGVCDGKCWWCIFVTTIWWQRFRN